ncbi:MAG: type II toxin-antitoxin system MqsA family antitoxin [Xanthomonadales bacterium]|nr:type II toxin-antitoxin system MqsA family antitoxin [Xanthomonadales bacterium]
MTECIACKSENIETVVAVERVVYKGHELQVPLEYSTCKNCGREFVPRSQILRGEAAVRDARKKFDGLMSSQEIAKARTSLSLSQEQASKVFGGGRNAFSKYERGEVSQSVAMDKLIRVCLKHQHVFQELAEKAGVKVDS